MKSSDAKVSKCRLEFSSKIIIFKSLSLIYIPLFNINCIENDLYIALKIKLLNLNIGG